MSTIDTFAYNRQGQVFTACNQAGATVTLINTSTTTGFVLSNPWGSGKNLGIIHAQFNYTTVPVATAVVFLCLSIAPSVAAHGTTTALGVYRADGGGATGANVARAYSASTTPNLPVYTRALGYAPTTPATASGLTVSANVNGEIIVAPGAYLQISYITTAPVGITSMTWVEITA